jgi:Arc/MetJ-type ribon-helix-helix transcriptional regulator
MATPTTIDLPDDLRAFAEECVRTGKNTSIADVVREALEAKKLAALRDAGFGVEQSDDELMAEAGFVRYGVGPMPEKPHRVIVDPAVWEAEVVFQRMMARLRVETPEERLRFDVEHGLRNPDGTWKLPEGDPCVTIVR